MAQYEFDRVLNIYISKIDCTYITEQMKIRKVLTELKLLNRIVVAGYYIYLTLEFLD
jgi:cephalosporin hydroxylase